MTKKRALTKLIFIIVLAVIGLLVATLSFRIPGTANVWNSFVGGINTGTEISNGVVIEYTLASKNDADKISDISGATLNELSSQIYAYYGEANVYLVGENKVRVEVSGSVDTSDASNVTTMLTLITGNSDFCVYGEHDDHLDEIITAKNVKGFSYKAVGSSNVFSITLDKEGAKRLEKITEEMGSFNIRFNEGDQASSISTDVTITDGVISLTVGNEASGVAMGTKVMCERAGGVLTYEMLDVVSASNGPSSTAIITSVVLVVSFIVALALLVLLHRNFGLMALLAFVFFGIFYSLFLAIVPFVNLTLAGLVGVVSALFISILTSGYIFGKVENEFTQGKKLPTALESGFKKSLKPILDTHILLIIVTVVLSLISQPAVKNFASSLFVGLLINLFISLVVLKQLCKIVIRISSKPRNYNLKKVEVEKENA